MINFVQNLMIVVVVLILKRSLSGPGPQAVLELSSSDPEAILQRSWSYSGPQVFLQRESS